MSLACEAEMGVQNELALRFTIIAKPAPILEYIKTISSHIGASHILAVFEENDTLKVFFDDKRFVDSLIRSGIHIMGHHIRVDYVVPPGTKILLSNVDPVVPNYDLMKILSAYGSIVSPIICPPISDDMEFCHIGSGVRYCYMVLCEPIPNKLEFKYNDQLCVIKIRQGDEMTIVPYIKSDVCELNEVDFGDCIAGPSNSTLDNQESSNPVVVSVGSAALESNSDVQFSVVKHPIKRSYVRRKGQIHKALKIKKTKVTATTRAAKKIKQNVKHKWIGANKMKSFRRGKRGRKPLRLLKKSLTPPILASLSPASCSDVDDTLTPPLLITATKGYSEGCLTEEKLLLFIEDCKHNRTPLELAKKYLGSDCTNNAIHNLIELLERYARNSSCQSLKMRLGRLCKLLTESMNALKS